MIYEVYPLPKSGGIGFNFLGSRISSLLKQFCQDGVIDARGIVEVQYLDGDLVPWGGVSRPSACQEEVKDLQADAVFLLRRFLSDWKDAIQRTHRIFEARFGPHVSGFAQLRRSWLSLGIYEEYGRPLYLELGFPSVEMGPTDRPSPGPGFWDSLDD